MAKLPWITEAKPSAQIDAQKSGAVGLSVSLPDILRQLGDFLQLAQNQEKRHPVSLPDTGCASEENGCPGWDRTSDQVINSHLLYR